MVRNRTVINAIIGAAVGVVLSFIPFSAVLGGAVAGFLEGPDERAGAIAGGLAGAITFLPVAAFAFLVFGLFGLGIGFGAPAEGVAFFWFLLLVAVPFLLFYFVAPSLVGGYLGAFLAGEYPDRRRRTRETIGFETESAGPSYTAGATPMRDRGTDPDRSPSDGLEDDRVSNRDRERDRDGSIDREREPDRRSDRER